MKNFAYTLFILNLVFFTCFTYSQNLINTDEWVAGTSGATPNFSIFGGDNSRVQIVGPHGNNIVAWLANPGSSTSGATGGWVSSAINVDANKTYRITYWLKSTGTATCSHTAAFFTRQVGTTQQVSPLKLNANGTTTAHYWPYISTVSIPKNKWVLVVGYLYGKGVTNYNQPNGIYDVTENKVLSVSDYKFPTSHNQLDLFLRNTLWNCSGNEQFYSYAPRIEEVTGNEPSISTLIAGSSNSNDSSDNTTDNSSTDDSTNDGSTGGDATNSDSDQTVVESPWRTNDSSLYYSEGNVGLGTSTPKEKFHIEGKLLVDAFSRGNGNGLFFREGFSSSNIYNLSIITFDHSGSNADGLSINGYDGISFSTGSNSRNERMRITQNGNVGIGTTNPGSWKLAVNGNIRAKEIKVETDWADYVFESDYDLPTLKEVETHIQTHGHLINIPSAKEVEANGIELGEMNKLLLEKIEELTLYIIQLEKRVSKIEQ